MSQRKAKGPMRPLDARKKPDPRNCPHCQVLQGRHYSVISSPIHPVPGPGDFGVCDKCQGIVRFIDGGVEPWTLEQATALDARLGENLAQGIQSSGYEKKAHDVFVCICRWLEGEMEKHGSRIELDLPFNAWPESTAIAACLGDLLEVWPVGPRSRALCEYVIENEPDATALMLQWALEQWPKELGYRTTHEIIDLSSLPVCVFDRDKPMALA